MDEPRLGGARRGHVQQQHVRISNGRCGCDGRVGRRGEQRRVVHRSGPAPLGVRMVQQSCEVGHRLVAVQVVGPEPGHPNLGEGARQRAGEAGHAGHRIEVGQVVGRDALERRPRGHGLVTERGCRQQALGRQERQRQPRGQLADARARHADQPAARDGHPRHQFVRRRARRADDEHRFRVARMARQVRLRLSQAFGGGAVAEQRGWHGAGGGSHVH